MQAVGLNKSAPRRKGSNWQSHVKKIFKVVPRGEKAKDLEQQQNEKKSVKLRRIANIMKQIEYCIKQGQCIKMKRKKTKFY